MANPNQIPLEEHVPPNETHFNFRKMTPIKNRALTTQLELQMGNIKPSSKSPLSEW